MTRTKEEAHRQIMAFRNDLISGKAAFADLASRESHCSSARRGGAPCCCSSPIRLSAGSSIGSWPLLHEKSVELTLQHVMLGLYCASLRQYHCCRGVVGVCMSSC